jgi:hypothetical protein
MFFSKPYSFLGMESAETRSKKYWNPKRFSQVSDLTTRESDLGSIVEVRCESIYLGEATVSLVALAFL